MDSAIRKPPRMCLHSTRGWLHRYDLLCLVGGDNSDGPHVLPPELDLGRSCFWIARASGTCYVSEESAWRPLLSVTRGRILAAKSLLAIATLNFVACIGGTFYAVHIRIQDPAGLGAGLILASVLLQNCIYIALHWAFRPENLFSVAFIRGITAPLSLLSRGTNRT